MNATPRPNELDELMAILVREIDADERAARAAQEAADAEADRVATEQFAGRLALGPVRVRVQSRYCDNGREGIVRQLPETAADGTAWGYVEDMTDGDDGNRTRYHRPKDLLILD